MITTSASAPPLISCPTTDRPGWWATFICLFCHHSSVRTHAHLQGKSAVKRRRRRSSSQLGTALSIFTSFLTHFAAHIPFAALCSLVAIIIPREYYLHRALCWRASERASSGRPFSAFLRSFAVRASAAEMLMRQHAGGDASISFLLSQFWLTRAPNEPATWHRTNWSACLIN